MTNIIIKGEDQRRAAIEAIEDLDFSPVMEVVIRKFDPRRHNGQNDLYWKYVEIMRHHFGYTKEEMHTVLKNEILGEDYVEFNGKMVPKERTTTDKTVKEFSEYLREVSIFAANWGIALPVNEREWS